MIIGIIIIAAVVVFVIFSAVFYGMMRDSNSFTLQSLGGKVAVVDISGVIDGSESVVRQLKGYMDDKSVKALILRIDSPGGGVAPSQEIYDQVLKAKENDKFVIASMSSVAASGGYYIACAADTIIANPGTITGSIGVIFSFPVFGKLMDKVGVELEVIKSGELKDVGNFSRPVTPKERKMLQAVVDDTYDQFISVVAASRGLDKEYVRKLADGSVYSGRQALEKGLVDILGTYEDAVSIAGARTDLGDDPYIVKERPRRRTLLETAGSIFGIDSDLLKEKRLWPSLEYRYIQ